MRRREPNADVTVKRPAGSADEILSSLPEEVVVGLAEDLLELLGRRITRAGARKPGRSEVDEETD